VDLNAIIFNDMLVICAADGPLSFLSPTDGKILFTREVVAGHTPLIRDGNLIFGSNAGEIVVIDGNGMIQYQIPVSDSGISSLTVWRAHYVAASFKGELLQIDAKTLAVRSKFQLGSKYSTVFGDLVTDNNHLAVYSSRNRLYVFK
jgi:outer membrane protein assembly factor BamB